MSDFLQNQLTQKLPAVYEKKYPMLWGVSGEVIPVQSNPSLAGVEKLEAEYASSAGKAKIYADISQDIPLISTDTSRDDYKTFIAMLGAFWSIFDEERARVAGKDIVTRKMMAIRRGLDEKAHDMAVYGTDSHTGLLNSSLVPVINPTLDLDNAATTAQDLIDFFSTIMGTVEDQTEQVEMVDTVLVPYKVHRLFRTKTIGVATQSVLSYLIDNYGPMGGGTVRRILPRRELSSDNLEANGVKAPGTNKDMIVLIPSNPDAMGMQVKGFTQLPLTPNDTSTGYTQVSYVAQSEVMFHYPNSCLYVNIDKLT